MEIENIEGEKPFEVQFAKASMLGATQTHRITPLHRMEEEPKITTNSDEPLGSEPAEGQLTIDVYQTPLEIVVESALAGVGPEDVDINVTNDSVTIRGERHRESRIHDEDYLYQECYWGRFSRSVILPQEVDPDEAHATFKNGILTVHLPKVVKQKSKKLKIRTD